MIILLKFVRIKIQNTVKEKVKYLVIGFVNKNGSPLKMENMVARKLAVAAMKNHVLATTEMSIIVKVMYDIMVKLSADLNGLFPILVNTDVKILVKCARL